MHINKEGDNRPNLLVIILGLISILFMILGVLSGGFATDPTIVDNLDYSYTATWNFEDLTNYTLSNLTAANGEVNITENTYFWNQSHGEDFEEGQKSNVVFQRDSGDGD